MAHLGARVSDLLDGRLSAAEEERCWAHVHECHSCRDLVEREGWVKTRLAQFSSGTVPASDALKHSLRGADVALPPAFPTAGRSRSLGLAVLGGGAAGACVMGVLVLGIAAPTRVEPRPPVTDLSREVAPVTRVSPAPAPQRRRTPTPGPRFERTPGPRVDDVVRIREKMLP